MIAAISANKAIGKDGKLPRDYPEDLAYFKKITMWCPVIMGRNTYESIWKELPGRRNIIITSHHKYENLETYTDPDDAIAVLDNDIDGDDQVFIIWGASIYEHFLPTTERLYLTEIKKVYEWDTFFPDIPEQFIEMERKEYEHFDFVLYHNKDMV